MNASTKDAPPKRGKPKATPSQERLRTLLNYDPVTGLLFWRHRSPDVIAGKLYPADRVALAWNKKHADKPAFSTRHSRGYFHGAIDQKKFLTHRIIWKWMTGEDPAEIDHLNGDKRDNCFKNLRASDRRSNMRNAAAQVTRKIGISGVYWRERDNKWVARIKVAGRFQWIGSFFDIEDAIAARKARQCDLGFSERHGNIVAECAR